MLKRLLWHHVMVLIILVWGGAYSWGDTSSDGVFVENPSSSGTSVLMPTLAGWPAPVVALFNDSHDRVRIHEWRWEEYPVGVAVWQDGSVVWSLAEHGFSAPYAIGKVPANQVKEFLTAMSSMGVFNSPRHKRRLLSDARRIIISLADGKKGLTIENPGSQVGTVSVETQAEWDLLLSSIKDFTKSVNILTSMPLVFDQRCVSCLPTTQPKNQNNMLPPEVHAVWVPHEEFLMQKPTAQEATLAKLAEAGFNTICLNTNWRSWVTYPNSDYLFQSPLRDSNLNVIDTLIVSIHNKKMRAEAWPEYGFYAGYDKNTSRSLSGFLGDHPELAAVDSEGRDYFYNPTYGYYKSLCSANPMSHKLLIGLYSEMLERYPFDGLNLDRIRFPNTDFCYCDYCRKQFAEDTGTSLTVFPKGSAEWQTWIKWREARVTTFMRELSSTIRTNFPGRTITACAVPLEEMEAKGQNWPEWVKLGYVDAVVPLIYSASVGMEAAMAAITELVPDQSRVIYGLLPREGVDEQICKLRQAGARGYSVWHIGTLTPATRDVFEAANIGFGPGPSTLGQPK